MGGQVRVHARRVTYRDVKEGGRGVPHLPLKLDSLFVGNLCVGLAADVVHPCQYFIRLWLSFPLRRLVRELTNVTPKEEHLPWHYRHVVQWLKKVPKDLPVESWGDHRAMYRVMRRELCMGVVVPGVGSEVWSRIQPRRLDHRLQDVNWLAVYGRMPVREVMYRHGLTGHPQCPWRNCEREVSIRHVLWECFFARGVWFLLGNLLKRLDTGFDLNYDKMLKAWRGGGGRVFFLPWLVVSMGKKGIWEARVALVKTGKERGVREV